MTSVNNNAIFNIPDEIRSRPGISYLIYSGLTIGENSIIAPGVVFVDHDHNLESPDKIKEIGNASPIVIGKNCWIGVNSIILKGVTLGDNCIVGAGSVVTRSFPKNSIISGNPAKLMRKR